MRICIAAYDTYNNTGGVHSWVVRFAKQLIRSGEEVAATLYSSCLPGQQGTLEQVLIEQGIPHCRTRYENATEDNVAWTVEAVSRLKADVFITNCMHAAWYASPQLERGGIPCVAVSHSDDPFYHALASQCVAASGWYQVSGLVAVSQYLLDQAKETASDRTAFARIPCGIDVSSVARQKVHQENDFKVAYVGRFVEEQKRCARLTELMCKAALKFPQLRADFIGTGPSENAMREIINRYGLGGRINITGWLPEDEVVPRLASMDALALLSDYEGLPIALIEAMSVGVIPICSDIKSGICELVKHRENGYIISPDEAAFSSAVGELIRHPEHRSTLSRNCIARIHGDFLNPICTERWVRFLSEIVAVFPERSYSAPKTALPSSHPDLASCDNRRSSTKKITSSGVSAIVRKWRKSIWKRTLGRMKAA